MVTCYFYFYLSLKLGGSIKMQNFERSENMGYCKLSIINKEST